MSRPVAGRGSLAADGGPRVDHVGSLLRPEGLLQAARNGGHADAPTLRRLEDEAILRVLECQCSAGVGVFTDGELRRRGFVTGFIDTVDGFAEGRVASFPWRGGTGEEPPSPNAKVVARRLATSRRIAADEARFMIEHSPGPFKITLPGPLIFALAGWQTGVTDSVYRDRSELLAEAGGILAREARQLAEEGVPYIQIDTPSYTSWVDDELKRFYRSQGVDLDGIFSASVAADNAILAAAREAGALPAVHLCRGNSMGRWRAAGGYDAVAEVLFNELRCDRLLLEYDSPRSGSFEPLRLMPDHKVVVLGLISTKHGQLEQRDEVLRRIDAAARYLPTERLALSPQCGFASSGRGNPLTEDEQWRKLELVASVAEQVWGSHDAAAGREEGGPP